MFKLNHSRPKKTLPSRPVLVGSYSSVIHGQTVKYTLKRSFRAKYIWLKYVPESGLQVVIPQHYKLSDLPHFLNQHSGWILRRVLAAKETEGCSEAPHSLNNILFMGKPLRIIRREGSNCAVQLHTETSELTIVQPPGQKYMEKILFIWLKRQAVKNITQKVNYWASRLEVKFNRITVRNQKSLWGSCSRLHNLNFNWRLVMLPEEIQDYVVIHEVCHLKEMNHSAKFWKIVAENCPNWHEHRLWLKRRQLKDISKLGD
ncbi:MAG TPA: SprT family zinc-dependent metalloprotease [Dehalococcoidales bacterium]|nr:SprT family zinc-dependent metalloprotease [Dehalococcoidales bacterium]